jgi:hypothetical protein
MGHLLRTEDGTCGLGATLTPREDRAQDHCRMTGGEQTNLRFHWDCCQRLKNPVARKTARPQPADACVFRDGTYLCNSWFHALQAGPETPSLTPVPLWILNIPSPVHDG